MFVVQVIEELISIVAGLLGHFVTGAPGSVQSLYDYEWNLIGAASYQVSDKGNYLNGALADILTYGAILVDWIVQGLLNTSVNAVTTAPP